MRVPIRRVNKSIGTINCYRCMFEAAQTVKACKRCGCVAFFHGQRPSQVPCPAFDDGAVFVRLPSIPKGLTDFSEERFSDRYLDVGLHETGRRRRHRGGAQ